jgi:hypothetical protein
VNPAQLGFQDKAYSLSFANSRVDPWLPGVPASDLMHIVYHSDALQAGIDLAKIFPQANVPLTLGVGYTGIDLQLGNLYTQHFDSTGLHSTLIVPDGKERTDQISVGVGYDCGVMITAGAAYKHVKSHVNSPLETIGYHDGTADLFDYGFLVNLPIVDMVTRWKGGAIQVAPGMIPFFDCSIGMSWNNMGQSSFTYFDDSQADALPRTAHAGIALRGGLSCKSDNGCWNPIAFIWTIEAQDMLVSKPNPIPSTWGYQGGIGDIDFFDQVMLGHTNKSTQKLKGWEICAGEMFSLRGGHFLEDQNNGARNFRTYGWGINSAGVVKLLRLLYPADDGRNCFLEMADHFSIRYDVCRYEAAESPLDNTSMSSVSLRLSY